MKMIFAIVFLLLTVKASAQLAILNGSDAFVNVSDKGAIKSKTIGKINKGDVFAISPFDKNLKSFTKVWFHYNPKKEKNFIISEDHKEGFLPIKKILLLDDLKKMTTTAQTAHGIVFKNEVYEIIISIKPFDKKHFVFEQDNGETLIDGKYPWGYHTNPNLKEINSIQVKTSKRTYLLPKEAIQNLYQPNLELTKVYIKNPNDIYINMSNADGSESYEAVWHVLNGELIKLTVMQVIP